MQNRAKKVVPVSKGIMAARKANYKPAHGLQNIGPYMGTNYRPVHGYKL